MILIILIISLIITLINGFRTIPSPPPPPRYKFDDRIHPNGLMYLDYNGDFKMTPSIKVDDGTLRCSILSLSSLTLRSADVSSTDVLVINNEKTLENKRLLKFDGLFYDDSELISFSDSDTIKSTGVIIPEDITGHLYFNANTNKIYPVTLMINEKAIKYERNDIVVYVAEKAIEPAGVRLSENLDDGHLSITNAVINPIRLVERRDGANNRGLRFDDKLTPVWDFENKSNGKALSYSNGKITLREILGTDNLKDEEIVGVTSHHQLRSIAIYDHLLAIDDVIRHDDRLETVENELVRLSGKRFENSNLYLNEKYIIGDRLGLVYPYQLGPVSTITKVIVNLGKHIPTIRDKNCVETVLKYDSKTDTLRLNKIRLNDLKNFNFSKRAPKFVRRLKLEQYATLDQRLTSSSTVIVRLTLRPVKNEILFIVANCYVSWDAPGPVAFLKLLITEGTRPVETIQQLSFPFSAITFSTLTTYYKFDRNKDYKVELFASADTSGFAVTINKKYFSSIKLYTTER